MFQNVAYRPSVYKTGARALEETVKKGLRLKRNTLRFDPLHLKENYAENLVTSLGQTVSESLYAL